MATTNTPDVTAMAADIGDASHTEHGYISDKSRYLARLKRIEAKFAASTAWWRKTPTASTS